MASLTRTVRVGGRSARTMTPSVAATPIAPSNAAQDAPLNPTSSVTTGREPASALSRTSTAATTSRMLRASVHPLTTTAEEPKQLQLTLARAARVRAMSHR